MAIQNIQVGGLVPIELQVADGAEDQYPQALVYDQDSVLLTTLNLGHDNQGNYSGAAYVMPDKLFIKAVYIVYSDTARTVENIRYERDLEVFYRLDLNAIMWRSHTIAEMSPGDLPLEPTPEQLLNYLYRKLRNSSQTTFVLDTVFADDGITALFKSVLDDTTFEFIKQKYLSG